eukprot:CAMPEP_0168605660 /NCGR_PEP_ID=MMETSP0420-20121227/16114_1 /TAXON_ID=498008 /ORGANISM="Pessonella sp." /LENGTH=197 /DNA_ID=CAMNT_0008645189 /DNA_START=98 /DNA_END=687 /DNA_ORIENTATION=+
MRDFAFGLYRLLNNIDPSAPSGNGTNQATVDTFCQPLRRFPDSLPGCSFEVEKSGIIVDWFSETQYWGPLLRPTLGEMRSALPDVIIGSGGIDGIMRDPARWRQTLLREVPQLIDWIETKFKDRPFYWRTNPAIASKLRKPRTPPDTNDLLKKADTVVRSMFALFNKPVLDVAPSTRANGADELYIDERHHPTMAAT